MGNVLSSSLRATTHVSLLPDYVYDAYRCNSVISSPTAVRSFNGCTPRWKTPMPHESKSVPELNCSPLRLLEAVRSYFLSFAYPLCVNVFQLEEARDDLHVKQSELFAEVSYCGVCGSGKIL
jgi:hypothetical protein